MPSSAAAPSLGGSGGAGGSETKVGGGSGAGGGGGEGGCVEVVLDGPSGLARDYFGSYLPGDAGSMAYHWRQVQWVDDDGTRSGGGGGKIVGVHGNSGYLFTMTFPPSSTADATDATGAATGTHSWVRAVGADTGDKASSQPSQQPRIEIQGRIASAPSQVCDTTRREGKRLEERYITLTVVCVVVCNRNPSCSLIYFPRLSPPSPLIPSCPLLFPLCPQCTPSGSGCRISSRTGILASK